ncbi:MAG: four helix bundle protein [Gemmatimonadales bacterium]
MLPYERFDAWKKSHELALAIHRQTTTWPKDERFGLTSQIRRSAFSVPANLVEGQARRGAKEFRRFLDIAWGSLAEVGYTLRYARDLGYLTDQEYQKLQALRDEVGPPLFGLLRSMGRPEEEK